MPCVQISVYTIFHLLRYLINVAFNRRCDDNSYQMIYINHHTIYSETLMQSCINNKIAAIKLAISKYILSSSSQKVSFQFRKKYRKMIKQLRLTLRLIDCLTSLRNHLQTTSCTSSISFLFTIIVSLSLAAFAQQHCIQCLLITFSRSSSKQMNVEIVSCITSHHLHNNNVVETRKIRKRVKIIKLLASLTSTNFFWTCPVNKICETVRLTKLCVLIYFLISIYS